MNKIATAWKGQTCLLTGATGMLGTALIVKLILHTQVDRVYVLVRGGESRFWTRLHEILPVRLVTEITASGKITVLAGDISLENLGIHDDIICGLRDSVSICIHAASSINLKHDLEKTAKNVIQPSLTFATLALDFKNLKRFVFVSTAYANAFLHFIPSSDGERNDCFVAEKIYPLSESTSQRDPFLEYDNIQAFGDTPEYSCVPHPFAYAYAKHLTERLLLSMFEEKGKEKLLMLFRPSCFGPSESEPFPYFETQGSVPGTSVLCACFASAPTKALFTSNLADPSKANIDEVPVDIVVNRLVAHVAFGTHGCVHAVSGAPGRRSFQDMFRAVTSLRKWWWPPPTLVWCSETTNPKRVSFISKLFGLCGCSFLFGDDRTAEVWAYMDDDDREKWYLWTRRDPKDMSDFAIRCQIAGEMLQDWFLKRHKISPRMTRLLLPDEIPSAKSQATVEHVEASWLLERKDMLAT